MNKPDQLIVAASTGLTPDMFAVDGHKYIWMAMSYIVSKGEKLDAISIMNVYTDEKAKESINELGGIEYIEHMKASPVASNVGMFVGHIIQAAARRELYNTAEAVKKQALNDTDSDLNEVLGEAEHKFRDVAIDFQVAQEVVKMGDGIAERLKDRMLNPQDVLGLRTGWNKFDLAIQGLQKGKLIIIAARSKVGKSVTMLNWCLKIAVDDNVPVLYIDTEMTVEEQQDRALSNLSQVPEEEIKNGQFARDTFNGLGRDKLKRVQEASKKLKNAPLYHVYLPHFTPEKVASLVRKYQIDKDIQLLAFDYIKLPSSDNQRQEKEYQALGYLTSTLKDIAGMLQIPVIAGVQLNRGAVNNDEPDEGTIAGSDRILHLANTLCFLRWKSEEERAMSEGNQRFKIAFNRGGSSNLDWIDINYQGHILTQKEVD